MKVLFVFAPIFILLFASSITYAHEGHQDEDIVLKSFGNLGEVDFAISCDAEPQQAFNTGLALLHHMMYAQAELLFQASIEKNPECAMLYWGYSMSLFHPLWPDKISDNSLEFGRLALVTARELPISEREGLYLAAAENYYSDWQKVHEIKRIEAWAKAHAALYESYPSDIDAAAFYALTLLVTASQHDKTFSANKKAGEVLASVLAQEPLHPGAIHYSIHAFDNPVLAKSGAEPARIYDKIAPNVPHALHMPTHIFVRLGAWEDAVSWNKRSAQAALEYPTKGATSHHYVHALDYQVYGQLQLGEGKAASKVLADIDQHHPIQNTFPAAYALSTIPARILLEQGKWKKASKLSARSPDYIHWDKFPQVEAITYFARGLGAVRSGNISLANKNIAVLDQLYKKTMVSSPGYWAILVDAQRKSIQAWVLYSEGEKEKAITLMRDAADLEDSVAKNPVTPGAVLPARDLLGDMLLLEGDAIGAQEAYSESLRIGPNRLYSTLGLSRAKEVKMSLESRF